MARSRFRCARADRESPDLLIFTRTDADGSKPVTRSETQEPVRRLADHEPFGHETGSRAGPRWWGSGASASRPTGLRPRLGHRLARAVRHGVGGAVLAPHRDHPALRVDVALTRAGAVAVVGPGDIRAARAAARYRSDSNACDRPSHAVNFVWPSPSVEPSGFALRRSCHARSTTLRRVPRCLQ